MFVIGGNGSGKTTLAKLLTGLYAPYAGEIRLDGKPVTPANREKYRQLFSVVFDGAMVFDNLWGLESNDLDQRAGEYLRLLELDHVVTVTNGSFSTTSLSRGQRKRLAFGQPLTWRTGRSMCSTNGPPTRTPLSARCSILICFPS